MIKIEGRSLKIPTQERIIGWVGDNKVEVRTFELPRMYGNVDLSEFDFKLDTQAGNVKNIIDLDKSVSADKITLTWTVRESHILHPGHMSIQIRAFKGTEEKWHSAQAYVRVQPSINAEQSIPDPLPSEFVQMEQRVTDAKNAAIGAAQDAKAHADRAQDIADTFSDVTLPAAISAVENAGQAKVDLAEAQAIIAATKAQEASDSAAAALASEQATKASEDNAAGHAVTATEQADRAQDIADTFENETLPAAITAVEAAGQAKVDLAEQQANIAAGHAQTAATKAGEASSYADDAFEYKEAAEGAATIATEKAGQAANSAQIAEQQANIAATKAQEAHDSAERAKASEEAVKGVADEHRLKIAKIERELNDYKTIMSMVNINLEPKQQVSGYGIVSLPKNAANGQISVTAKGLTATQILKDGNFANGTDNWRSPGDNATLSINNNTIIVTGTGTIKEVSCIQYFEPNFHQDGHKYYLKARARVTNSDCTRLALTFRTSVNIDAKIIHTPVANQWYTLSGIATAIGVYAEPYFRLLSVYPDAATAEGKVMEVQEAMLIDLTATFGAGNEPTKEQCDKIFANWFDGTKSTISAFRIRSVSEDETQESSAYVIATDADTGEILELRSLPNGTKDEFRVSEGKLIQRIGHKENVAGGTVINYADMADGGQFVAYYADGMQQIGVKGDTLTADAVQLNYQLAEPVKIPVQVSGTLVSYPSGTVYIEPYVADAGIYTDKMEVLHKDLPIKSIEKLSKVDFTTGVEYELDPSQAVVSANRLSFTHPELQEGDIVFFIYEYDRESTIPEVEVEFYDSRYVVKDTETGKFYKWNIVVANGQPSIELVEV